MHVLQPVARGYARYQARFRTRHVSEPLHALSRRWEERAGGLLGRRELALWSEDGQGRDQLLERLVAQARAQGAMLRADSGWEPFDLTIRGDRWSNVELTTVTEEHGGGRRSAPGAPTTDIPRASATESTLAMATRRSRRDEEITTATTMVAGAAMTTSQAGSHSQTKSIR